MSMISTRCSCACIRCSLRPRRVRRGSCTYGSASEQLEDHEPNRDVVADRRRGGEGMEELVITERARPRVRPLDGEEDRADVVEHRSRDEEHYGDDASAAQELWGEPHRAVPQQ